MGMYGNFLAVDHVYMNRILEGKETIPFLIGDDYTELYIGKAWDAIQYLFTATINKCTPSISYVIRKYNTIHCESYYGASYLTVEQVIEVSAYLSFLSEDDIKKKYDFKSMLEAEVYPLHHF